MQPPPLDVRGFSHLCIRVSDMERSLRFYRDALGLRVIFDVELAGPGLEGATGERGARGRMVGCLVPGSRVTIELLGFAQRDAAPAAKPARSAVGYSNLALSVRDLAAAQRQLAAHGVAPLGEPVEIGGVRMVFVRDPDGTPLELVEFPNGASCSAEHNGA